MSSRVADSEQEVGRSAGGGAAGAPTSVVPTTDRTAWLEARRTGCGASDVAGILGISPWASPWSIWADKVGLTPLDDDAERDIDDPLTFGRDLEDIIRDRYERQSGLYVVGAQSIIRHPSEPWCFATVDGLVVESHDACDELLGDPGTLAVFESKYTSDPPWETIPEHYRAQGHWQMFVSQLTTVTFAVLHLPFGRPMFRTYELELDGTLLAHIVATVERFWFEHVVTGHPPEPDAHPATTKAIAAAWGAEPTQTLPRIELDEYEPLVAQLSELRKQRAVLDWQEERIANSIKHLIGELGARPGPNPTCEACHGAGIERTATPAEVDAGCELGVAFDPCPECKPIHALSDGYVAGALAVSWRSQSDTRLDTKAVRADHGTRYDRTSTKRVLRLHGKWQP